MSASGPTRNYFDVHFLAAMEGQADVDTIIQSARKSLTGMERDVA